MAILRLLRCLRLSRRPAPDDFFWRISGITRASSRRASLELARAVPLAHIEPHSMAVQVGDGVSLSGREGVPRLARLSVGVNGEDFETSQASRACYLASPKGTAFAGGECENFGGRRGRGGRSGRRRTWRNGGHALGTKKRKHGGRRHGEVDRVAERARADVWLKEETSVIETLGSYLYLMMKVDKRDGFIYNFKLNAWPS